MSISSLSSCLRSTSFAPSGSSCLFQTLSNPRGNDTEGEIRLPDFTFEEVDMNSDSSKSGLHDQFGITQQDVINSESNSSQESFEEAFIELPSPSKRLRQDRQGPFSARKQRREEGSAAAIAWSPQSRAVLTLTFQGATPTSYQKKFQAASSQAIAAGVKPPTKSALTALQECGISWEELVNHLCEEAPYDELLKREDSRSFLQSLKDVRSENEMSCTQASSPEELSLLRRVHLSNPHVSPIKAFWSPPRAGIFSRFCDFIRERFNISYGRNVSMAIAKDPLTGKIVYTVASTDGPPGGTHSELLAWDLLPENIRQLKKGVIFTERQPCCRGSYCNAKLRENLPEVSVVFTQPYEDESKRTFMDKKTLTLITCSGITHTQAATSSLKIRFKACSLGVNGSSSKASNSLSSEVNGPLSDRHEPVLRENGNLLPLFNQASKDKLPAVRAFPSIGEYESSSSSLDKENKDPSRGAMFFPKKKLSL